MYPINIIPKYLFQNTFLYANKQTIINLLDSESINLWLQYNILEVKKLYILILFSSLFKILKLKLPNGVNMTDEDLKYIPDIKVLKSPYNKNITDEGLRYIPNIKVLNFHNNRNITDEGLKYIPNIEELDLSLNKNITNKGLSYIPNVEYLNIDLNRNIKD